jgi:hypothetical protein
VGSGALGTGIGVQAADGKMMGKPFVIKLPTLSLPLVAHAIDDVAGSTANPCGMFGKTDIPDSSHARRRWLS